jgi:hypothetical protein
MTAPVPQFGHEAPEPTHACDPEAMWHEQQGPGIENPLPPVAPKLVPGTLLGQMTLGDCQSPSESYSFTSKPALGDHSGVVPIPRARTGFPTPDP